MKRSTRRMIEVNVIPPTLGALMGGILAWKAATQEELRFTPEIMQVLVLAGVMHLAIVVFDAWRSDEFERGRHFSATLVAFVGTGLVTLAGGLLQVMGLPELNWGFVFLAMIGFHFAGAVWFNFRYR